MEICAISGNLPKRVCIFFSIVDTEPDDTSIRGDPGPVEWAVSRYTYHLPGITSIEFHQVNIPAGHTNEGLFIYKPGVCQVIAQMPRSAAQHWKDVGAQAVPNQELRSVGRDTTHARLAKVCRKWGGLSTGCGHGKNAAFRPRSVIEDARAVGH